MINNQTTSQINKPATARMNQLPNIMNSTNNISYSLRYEHMTKIANYNQMNENQIWKEYEKLRLCLKQLNDQVLYHMERKAYNGSNKESISKDTEATLALLEQEKKVGQQRLGYYNNEFHQLEQRLNYLTTKKNLIQELSDECERVIAKTKQLKIQNKDFKRKQKLAAKNLLNGPTLAERLMILDQQLGIYQKKQVKHNSYIKVLKQKTQQTTQKIAELQKVIEMRIQQFGRQENYIAEQINLERFEELKSQKENARKYESIYKRNYLMKLKDLETLVNNIKRYDQIIDETVTNIVAVRNQVDNITAMVGSTQRRNSSSLMIMNKKRRSKQNKTVLLNQKSNQQIQKESKKGQLNDKNTQDYQSTHLTTQLGSKSPIK